VKAYASQKVIVSSMAVQVLESNFPSDRMPLLRWLMFTGVCTFGAVLLWYFGLFRLMLASDKTYISLIILCLLHSHFDPLLHPYDGNFTRNGCRPPGRRNRKSGSGRIFRRRQGMC